MHFPEIQSAILGNMSHHRNGRDSEIYPSRPIFPDLSLVFKVHDEDMVAALFDRTRLVLAEDGSVSGPNEAGMHLEGKGLPV